MTDEMKALRNTVELAIVSMGFCIAWTFDDFIFTSKKERK